MPDWILAATLVEAGAVVIGVAFAIVQVRQVQAKRREAMAVDLVHSFETPEFLRASRFVLNLPENCSVEEIRSRGDPVEFAVHTILISYESIGLLVHRRLVPLSLVDEYMGGFARTAWNRLHRYVEYQRSERNFRNYGEWFQWLVDRLLQYPRPSKQVGAHVAFKTWKP